MEKKSNYLFLIHKDMAKKNKKSTKTPKQSNDEKKMLQYIKGLNDQLEEMHQSRQTEYPIEIVSSEPEYPIKIVSSETMPIEMDPSRQTEYPMEIVTSEPEYPIEMDLSFLSPSNHSRNIVVDTSPFPDMMLPSNEIEGDSKCQRLKKQVKRQNKVIDVLLQRLET